MCDGPKGWFGGLACQRVRTTGADQRPMVPPENSWCHSLLRGCKEFDINQTTAASNQQSSDLENPGTRQGLIEICLQVAREMVPLPINRLSPHAATHPSINGHALTIEWHILQQ